MRSTRGKTRAMRAAATQHYTEAAHRSVPVASNTPEASRKAGTRQITQLSRSRGWHTDSVYYRPREGWGQ